MRLGILAFLVACGGGSGSGGLSIDSLAAELAEVQCARIAECCDANERMDLPADCVGFFTALLEEEADIIDMRESIAAGRLRFDGNQATRCLVRIEGLTCGEFSAFLGEQQAATGLDCLDMLVGLVPNGGTCVENYDCETGFCGFDPARQTQICQAAIPAGGACSTDCEDRFECGRCEGALLCDPATATCQVNPAIVPQGFCDGA